MTKVSKLIATIIATIVFLFLAINIGGCNQKTSFTGIFAIIIIIGYVAGLRAIWKS